MVNSSVPAHAYYGSPVTGQRLSHSADSFVAAPSGEYIGRGNKCVAKDDTCEGMRVKGEHLCQGHLRSYKAELKKALEAEAVADGV